MKKPFRVQLAITLKTNSKEDLQVLLNNAQGNVRWFESQLMSGNKDRDWEKQIKTAKFHVFLFETAIALKNKGQSS